MARILNICDLAMAWGTFRNMLRLATAEEFITQPTAMVEAHTVEALSRLLDAVEDEHSPTGRIAFIDDAAEAFERAGFSRELGAAAMRLRNRTERDEGRLYTDSFREAWLDIIATDEFRRAAETERAAGETPAE